MIITSAALAPLRMAASTIPVANSVVFFMFLLLLTFRAADRHLGDFNRRQSHANRHALAVFAAYAHTLIERHIIADRVYFGERIGAVADQSGAPHRRRHFAILDQISFRSEERRV